MENRTQSDYYASIAHELITTEERLKPVLDSGVDIVYLASDKERYSQGRAVYGECERIPHKYRWAIPYEFAITIYEPHAAFMTDEQLRILMLHELMHVGCKRDGNEWTYRIVPHDIEDFRTILEAHGLDWSAT